MIKNKLLRIIFKESHRIESIVIDKKKIKIYLNDNVLNLDCYNDLIKEFSEYNIKIFIESGSFLEHI